jgi:hypothetical protein
MVAYFIRRAGEPVESCCSVIKLYSDDREEVVQDSLTLIEAEILCAAKIADIPRPAAAPSAGPEPRIEKRRPADTRQLALKF